MSKIRLIARLDIKGSNLIKGVQFEGLRQLGDPHQFAKRYYEEGIDEILYIDIVASLYQRSKFIELIRKTVKDIYIPVTVGGGIRSMDDVRALLRAGADKVAINTAAIKRPELITEVAERFGSQCMVLSIEAKRTGNASWEAYTDNGREHSGVNVIEWVERGVELGAGEILLTSVDREGTRRGFDLPLIRDVCKRVSVPIVVSGGMGGINDLFDVAKIGDCGAIAFADVIHYNRLSVSEIRSLALAAGLDVRKTI